MVHYRTTSQPCGTSPFGFGAWSQPACVAGLAILWVALTILFNSVPEIDEAVSSFFFVATECTNAATTKICGDFPAGSVRLLKTLRRVFWSGPAWS
jgi:lipid A 4'-phosphatase